MPTNGVRKIDHLMAFVIINISPISFGKGGRPSLAAQAMSHQSGRRTVIVLNPRVINILRVCVRS